ncbi:hypothetical protein KZP23_18855 [Echinicola marina]|uniref:hypothetical protein n=1 Tax=Echinicola marina TaxID=2859768 RepID=UPI001CF6C547|nr:hypothetical protein [Echinicola marina]UCS92719.1 hypothetical protein KZP23_18855 [Echinicola marina]
MPAPIISDILKASLSWGMLRAPPVFWVNKIRKQQSVHQRVYGETYAQKLKKTARKAAPKPTKQAKKKLNTTKQ